MEYFVNTTTVNFRILEILGLYKVQGSVKDQYLL